MICAIGELLIDFMQVEKNEYGFPLLSASPGGAPANFLVAVKKQGIDASFIGKVGDDAFGNMLVSALRDKNIDVTGIVTSPDVFTTLAFVTLDSKGERSFSFARKPGADTCLCADEVSLQLIDKCSIFHFGSLSFTDEPSESSVINAVKYAQRKSKIISYDPNYRPSLWKNEETAREKMLEGFKYADIIKLSDDEADFIFGMNECDSAELLFNEYGCSLVFVTLGERGCYCKSDKGCFYVKSREDVTAIDTTGAGDVFTGTAEALLLKTGKQLCDISFEELKNIASEACTVASLSTLHHGGMEC